MFVLLSGLFVFLGVHSVVIFARNFRAKYRKKHLLAYKAVYGLLSLAGFALIVIGYGQARLSPVFLYFPPTWLRHVNFLLMLPVFILFFTPYLSGKISRAIYKITRHPQLLAVKIWAMSHLLVNGTVADLCLFGGFLVWAVLDVIALNRLPADNPPNRPPALKESVWNDFVLIMLGIGLYVGFLLILHSKLIGIALV